MSITNCIVPIGNCTSSPTETLTPRTPLRGGISSASIDECKPTVKVLAKHQILWSSGKLALGAGQELSTVRALEGLDLSGDEHGIELLLQRLVDGGSDKRHVRIGDLSSRERETHGRVEGFLEAVLDHGAGWSVLSTVDSQPNIDRLIFR